MIRSGRLLLVFLLAAAWLAAEDKVQVSASLSESVVERGTPFYYTLTVSKPDEDPEFPKVKGIEVRHSSSSESVSSHISIINGKFKQVRKHTVSYRYMLYPLETGTFVFPPIEVKIGGKVYETESLSIRVRESGSSSSVSPSQGGYSYSGNDASSAENFIFMKCITDKTNVYVNEALYVSDKVFTRLPTDFVGISERRKHSGFLVEPIDKNYSSSEVKIDDKNYVTKVMESEVLFPIKAGEYEIGQNVYVFDIRSGHFSRERVNRRTPEISISVLPLPNKGRPDDFSGAVGSFTIESSIDKTIVKAGEPLVLSVKVSGSGNLKTAVFPDYEEIISSTNEDVKVFKGEAPVKNDTSSGRLKSEKSAEFTILASQEGALKIPAVAFSFFDPELEQYKSVESRAFEISVEPGAELLAGDKDIAIIDEESNEDIRHIKGEKGSFGKGYVYLLHRPLVYVWIVFLAALCFGAFLIKKERSKLMQDEQYRRRKGATAFAKRCLKTAYGHLSDNDVSAYYGELERALNGYLANKLGLAKGSFFSEIEEKLKEKGADEESINEVKVLLDEFSYMRYTPSASRKDLKGEHYSRTAELISKLEDLI